MAKKGGGGGNFNNRAARRFRKPDKIDTMPQEQIFEILNSDIDEMLSQITKGRNHQGEWPTYIENAFANLSTPLWFYEYVNDHVQVKIKKGGKKIKLKTDLDEDQIESLKTIIASAFKKSATNQFPQQTQEFKPRNKYLGKTFAILDPKNYYLATKKLKLSKSQAQELAIQVYGNPVGNMRFVHRLFNNSNVSDKKKLKIMKEMYGERFATAVGAAMTVRSTNSDCVAMLYSYMMSKKKKKRAPYVLEYARAYKQNKESYFRLESDGEFYRKNKDLIKELIKLDIGFKKAFKRLKPKANADPAVLSASNRDKKKRRDRDRKDDKPF